MKEDEHATKIQPDTKPAHDELAKKACAIPQWKRRLRCRNMSVAPVQIAVKPLSQTGCQPNAKSQQKRKETSRT